MVLLKPLQVKAAGEPGEALWLPAQSIDLAKCGQGTLQKSKAGNSSQLILCRSRGKVGRCANNHSQDSMAW